MRQHSVAASDIPGARRRGARPTQPNTHPTDNSSDDNADDNLALAQYRVGSRRRFRAGVVGRPLLGSRGRRFKSCRPDGHNKAIIMLGAEGADLELFRESLVPQSPEPSGDLSFRALAELCCYESVKATGVRLHPLSPLIFLPGIVVVGFSYDD